MDKKKDFVKIKSHGFQEPKIIPEDYIFGAEKLPLEVIKNNGQWDNELPEDEMQKKNKVESMNCTNYGTENCIKIIKKAKYGINWDGSERYLGITSNTTHSGNSPQKVAENIRKVSGCIPEIELPFDKTITSWTKYYSPKPMTKKYLALGKEWMRQWDFKHEYVFSYIRTSPITRQQAMMKELKYSPLGASVMAWKYRNGMYYKNYSDRDNHWICIYGYLKDKYWKIFDSYDKTRKKLEWNYNFNFAKRYYLKRKEKYMPLKIVREIGTDEVFVEIGGGRFWVTPATMFNRLKKIGMIGGWKDVEQVEKFDTPLLGALAEMTAKGEVKLKAGAGEIRFKAGFKK